MATETRLIVRGDDFGMCHSVNEGIVRAFTEGIVTQASVMVPCPWFTEAAHLARTRAIPVGIHQTLTCEWDYLRWRPLTSGSSLAGPDGTFYRSVEEACAAITHEEAVAELLAQAGRFTAEGLAIGYLDAHMGESVPQAYTEVADQLGAVYLYSELARSCGLTSVRTLSDRDARDKKDWLMTYLSELGPGLHLLVTHPAVAGPELASLTGPDSVPYRWAEEYRISDLDLLTDPEVAAHIRAGGIELTTAAQALAAG
ncbi:MAG TPA: ChbG/HpnK family deacetylase [Streptosporangiaceae bacterium]|nr:ChbG/HpnK family deacetylase [Streptosporangiaceae bacterium]